MTVETVIKLPEWMKLETGFVFADAENDPFIILGLAGHREYRDHGDLTLWDPVLKERSHRTVAELLFLPKSLLAVMCYKGEMSLVDLLKGKDYTQEWWDSCKPIPEAAGKLLDLAGTVGIEKWLRYWIEPPNDLALPG